MAYNPQTQLREMPLGSHNQYPSASTFSDIPYSGVCILVIDMQRYCSDPLGGQFKECSQTDLDPKGSGKYSYYFKTLKKRVLPNIKQLLDISRKQVEQKVEIMYTVIESLTLDGRDRSLDYKISGFNVPKGSSDARIINPIQPLVS